MKAGDLIIDESEIVESFVRSSGPGGQNVNKVASAVELRFDARRRPSLPNDVAIRLIKLAGARATQDGVIVIFAQRYASQPRNREDARARLTDLIMRRRSERSRASPRARRWPPGCVGSTTRRAAARSRRCGAQAPERTDATRVRLKRSSSYRLCAEVALLDWLRRADGLAARVGRGLGFALRALHREKLGEVVRADELDLARSGAREFAQALLIGASLRAVELHHRLEQAQALRRGAAVRLDFGVMEIGVAAMEQPIVRAPDGDAAMPARMAGQRAPAAPRRAFRESRARPKSQTRIRPLPRPRPIS